MSIDAWDMADILLRYLEGADTEYRLPDRTRPQGIGSAHPDVIREVWEYAFDESYTMRDIKKFDWKHFSRPATAAAISRLDELLDLQGAHLNPHQGKLLWAFAYVRFSKSHTFSDYCKREYGWDQNKTFRELKSVCEFFAEKLNSKSVLKRRVEVGGLFEMGVVSDYTDAPHGQPVRGWMSVTRSSISEKPYRYLIKPHRKRKRNKKRTQSQGK